MKASQASRAGAAPRGDVTVAEVAPAERRRPLVAEIKRNALDDGPGIRTTVFFKGCPLRCVWCHNPETKKPGPEIMRVDAECLRCGRCVKACPTGAMGTAGPGGAPPPARDPTPCLACGRCVAACPGRGVRLVGAYHEPDELAAQLARDLPFFRNSGGGVTLSGGEPTLYPEYAERLLEALKACGVSTLLETSGHFAWPAFARSILPYLDTIYFDLKLADPEAHTRFTGRDNRLILDNLRRLVSHGRVSRRDAGAKSAGLRLLVRVPLVPGITTTQDNLKAIAGLLRDMDIDEVALLPYNPLWLTKAEGLGQAGDYAQAEWMTPEQERECADAFAGFRLVK